MQLEKGRSEASTWICAETELRLIYFGAKKIGFVGFLERGMRREDARKEAFGRDSEDARFWQRFLVIFLPLAVSVFSERDGQRERRETMGAEKKQARRERRAEGETRDEREKKGEACRDGGIFLMEKMRGEEQATFREDEMFLHLQSKPSPDRRLKSTSQANGSFPSSQMAFGKRAGAPNSKFSMANSTAMKTSYFHVGVDEEEGRDCSELSPVVIERHCSLMKVGHFIVTVFSFFVREKHNREFNGVFISPPTEQKNEKRREKLYTSYSNVHCKGPIGYTFPGHPTE
uniref:Uncharacterized protein n=1 Tax=Salix viminalis TaxID=40686 RepID=A0A6N2K4W5_SALVM